MKQLAEIRYDGVTENIEYEQIINKVVECCFQNEGLDKLKLYISIVLTTPDIIKSIIKYIEILTSLQMYCHFPCLRERNLEV